MLANVWIFLSKCPSSSPSSKPRSPSTRFRTSRSTATLQKILERLSSRWTRACLRCRSRRNTISALICSSLKWHALAVEIIRRRRPLFSTIITLRLVSRRVLPLLSVRPPYHRSHKRRQKHGFRCEICVSSA